MTRRERLESKLAKRAEWAGKAEQRADASFDRVHKLADSIPLGQPILVGHHSEGHARRDAERITSGMSKGCAEAKLADHHRSKADGLERQLDTCVFSDDPDAIEAIEARIAENEAKRERMKRVNQLYRKGDAEGLAALGLDLEKLRAKVASIGYSWVKAPYESWELSNLGGRITSDRKRLEEVKARQARAAAAEAGGGVSIERGESWCRVTFAEKPGHDVIEALKAAGFRWGAGSWSGPVEKLPACVAVCR